jgi:ubiquinone/menaquinone biosynthesis C-methylase UbiE
MPEMELAKDVEAGQAIYSRFVLSVYDIYVFGVSNRYIWKCPTSKLVQNYENNVSGKHLDIGVGSGYLLDASRFPVEAPRVGLLDLNSNSLDVTENRIKRYKPIIFKRNVFEKLSIGQHTFDSIGMNYLLHCLPGSMEEKSIVFDNAVEVLNPGGSLFGATLLQKGVHLGWAAKKLMRIYNRKGIFSNAYDSVDALEEILKSKFSTYSIDIYGCAAVFSGRI